MGPKVSATTGTGASRRPRVAIVTQGFAPAVGGSELYHLLTARALVGRADVGVFTSDLNLAGAPPSSVPGLPDGAVRYLRSVSLREEKLAAPGRLFRALDGFAPDLLWGNHPSPTADVGALYALSHRIPWVATYHADVRGIRWLDRRYQAWEDRLLRGAALVLVSTDVYARRLEARSIRPDRIRSVPLGPALLGGALGVRRVPPAPDSPGPEHPFLFVGVLDAPHAYKRLDRLIDAVAELSAAGRPVDLRVVGDGPSRPAYEARVRARGVAEHVTFAGALSDDALSDAYASAWALVLPASGPTEGFGIVAVEAATLGCPVVLSSALPAADLLAGYGFAERFGEGRPEELAAALERLWRDPERRRALAAAARDAAPEFSWDRLMPRLLAPVGELLDASARRRGWAGATG